MFAVQVLSFGSRLEGYFPRYFGKVEEPFAPFSASCRHLLNTICCKAPKYVF